MTVQSYDPDPTDWRLLAELQADGRLSFNELARRVHLSPPAVAERVRRLEQAGVITGYAARVDPARVVSRCSRSCSCAARWVGAC